jgi:ATP-dependent Clp protease ATP-binding subunit ClpA
MREVERRFTPEFRNRIDEIVLFQPLTLEEVRLITMQQVRKIEESLARSNRMLKISPEALEQLVRDGYSLCYGARFLKRTIEDRIKLPISQHWTEGNVFTAQVREGRVEVDVSHSVGGAYSELAATA